MWMDQESAEGPGRGTACWSVHIKFTAEFGPSRRPNSENRAP
jgi:hypothetical protein